MEKKNKYVVGSILLIIFLMFLFFILKNNKNVEPPVNNLSDGTNVNLD
jgi:uncharacterized integral membrane protein